MNKKIATALVVVLATFVMVTTTKASAAETYTNNSEFTNVYKYIKQRKGFTMKRFRYFKRVGKSRVGGRVHYNGYDFLFVPKLGGYVPEYQLRKIMSRKADGSGSLSNNSVTIKVKKKIKTYKTKNKKHKTVKTVVISKTITITKNNDDQKNNQGTNANNHETNNSTVTSNSSNDQTAKK